MIQGIFSQASPYKRRARSIAILWSLLIFIACLVPAKEIPEVNMPFIDKWVHFLLFGTFSFLWLCTKPTIKAGSLLSMLAISIAYGWLMEALQYIFSFLGRTYENMDIVADGVGGAMGIFVFYLVYRLVNKKHPKLNRPLA